MKKKLLSLLFVLSVCFFSYKNIGRVVGNTVIFNKAFTKETVQTFWSRVRFLDKVLPKDEHIVVYLNSNGGDAQSNVILLERISKLQSNGRKFEGVIYGYCYSACGSLFAIMNIRYMTSNAVYMQHKAYTRFPSATNNRLLYHLDLHRLKHDAYIIRRSLSDLMELFKSSDFIAPADFMLTTGRIHGIVPQPNIEEI